MADDPTGQFTNRNLALPDLHAQDQKMDVSGDQHEEKGPVNNLMF